VDALHHVVCLTCNACQEEAAHVPGTLGLAVLLAAAHTV